MLFRFFYLIFIFQCFNFSSIFGETERLLLVTGCARSGTNYISNILQKCGLDIQHEGIGADGSSSWVMTVEATSTPWGPARNDLKFKHIFHQVRHPLKVISSTFTTEGPKSWGYIMQHIPQITAEDPYIVRCAKYWYYWNIKGDELAEWTYRVEDIEQVWDEFEKRLGRELDRSALAEVPKTSNERKFKPPSRGNNVLEKDFTWEDLKAKLNPKLYHDIRTLAKKYGYSE